MRKKEGVEVDVCVDGLVVASSTINVTFGTVSFAPVVVGPQERHAAALIIISYSEAGFVVVHLHRCRTVPQEQPLGSSTSEQSSSTEEPTRPQFRSRRFSSASTEVVVLTETPCLSDRGQRVTRSLSLFIESLEATDGYHTQA